MPEARGWHATWAGWAALALLLEAVGLARGGPLTRSVRVYVVASAGGSALLGAGLGWLGAHWLVMPGGFGVPDVVGVVAGGIIGLAGWAHRTGRDDLLLRFWLWGSGVWTHLEPFIAAMRAYGMDVWHMAPSVVASLEGSSLQGLERLAEATEVVRGHLGERAEGTSTVLIQGILLLRLFELRVRGTPGAESP